MKLIIHSYSLALRHIFTVSYGSRAVQPTMVVELKDGGYSGYGEASAIFYYGKSVEDMAARLEALRLVIENAEWETPEMFWLQMEPYLREDPFVQCALDVAAHDLYGKKLGKPLYEIWGLEPRKHPISNYTLGIDSLENTLAKMREMPWPIYKIKLEPEGAIPFLAALRRETDAVFRVDANASWTAEQTVEYAPLLKDLGVEFIEQPLKPGNWEEQKWVYENSVLPLIADESCQVESDVKACVGYFHGINVKLMKCGGLTPARRMLEEARRLGLKTMVGCMSESSVGISAIAHLLSLLDYVDMDGALLLKEDIATGVRVTPQGVEFAEQAGTGAELI